MCDFKLDIDCNNFNADKKMVAEAYMKRGDYYLKKNKESKTALYFYMMATEIDKENPDVYQKLVDYYKSKKDKKS